MRQRDSVTLLTLGAVTAIRQDNPLTWLEDFRLLKSEYFLSLEGATFVSGDGPLIFGIADGKLTVAEIAAALTVDGPLGRQDTINRELAERPVWPLAQIDFAAQPGDNSDPSHMPLVVTKPRWTFSNPDGFVYFVYNMGSGALTTGGILFVQATHFGVWVT